MKIPQFAAAAAMLVSLVSCESAGGPGGSPVIATSARTGGSVPFAGGAPPSASYIPPERYYAFGGGYSSARRQTEGDDYNFLRYNDRCHRRCGYYRNCGYSYGWCGTSHYSRSRCW